MMNYYSKVQRLTSNAFSHAMPVSGITLDDRDIDPDNIEQV